MKMKLKAEIIDGNGKVITKEIETEIPEVTEFGDPENFYEVFNRFEKAGHRSPQPAWKRNNRSISWGSR